MFKKTVLVFLCFTLFLSIPYCKKKLPTQPDIPVKILPTIESFNASPSSIMLDGFSTLSWATSNATNVTIDHGVGTVSATGTKEVSPADTTTYTLTATNSDGQKTASCVVEIKKWAELEVSLIPESPQFYYDPDLNICISEFIIVLNETAGVGGQVEGMLIETYAAAQLCSAQVFPGGSFFAFGSLQSYVALVLPCMPDLVVIYMEGVDLNGYTIELMYWFTITWTQSTGTMRFLKVVEGASHHKLIK